VGPVKTTVEIPDALFREAQEYAAIPWPCLPEFLAVVTHPRIYQPPTCLEDALPQVDYWILGRRLAMGYSQGILDGMRIPYE
jgi:hypothetical protein